VRFQLCSERTLPARRMPLDLVGLQEEDFKLSIWDFLGLAGKPPQTSTPGQTETVRKIVDALDRLEPERARFIAAFAYILSRVAGADLKISPAETRAMERIVMEHAGLPEEQAIMVVQMARHQNLLFGGTENFLVTREFNKIATREQKLALLDCLYAVAAAEGLVSNVEDNEIRQIASELRLEHSDFIAVRLRYRDQISLLRGGEGAEG
jgi:uncharacterized tellurite resistance protein B-like protein